jgi:hypothetical protein
LLPHQPFSALELHSSEMRVQADILNGRPDNGQAALGLSALVLSQGCWVWYPSSDDEKA